MRELLLLLLLLIVPEPALHAADGETAAYFPLDVGNWWAYEELDDGGEALSRETWRIVTSAPGDRGGEFHVQSTTKRLDDLGKAGGGRRWEGHEYLRAAGGALRKRYPAGRDAEVEVTLLQDPLESGTHWHDAQGDCEVQSRARCSGPRGDLPDCAVVVCRLGSPTATVVTSTYARGVGMVRQEIRVVQFLPSMHGAGSVLLPCDGAKGGRSVLRLTGFHVASPR